MDDAWLNGEFGSRLRERRKKNALSQDALADSAGLSRTSIVNIESGRQGVSLGTLYRLADALACRAGDLLPDPPEMPAPKIAIGDSSVESRLAVLRVLQRAQREDR